MTSMLSLIGAFGRHSRKSVLALALVLSACAAAPERSTTPIQLEETRFVARHDGGETHVESYDASQLFERAYALGQDGHCPDAVPLYDRVIEEFPTSRFVDLALYNAGLCLARAAEYESAVRRFRQLIERSPDSRDAKYARFLLTEALVEQERWPEALEGADTLLTLTDLSSDERMEAMTRRAQALFGLARLDDAERAARDAITYFRTRRADQIIADEFFEAAAYFSLAETLRARSEAMTLPDSDVARQHEILDRRSALLLQAQAAYFDTMRTTNAQWAAAAGYRIGSMYENLYRALTTAPVPPPSRPMNAEQRALYEAEYRRVLADRVRPLMRHAIRYWELTLLMVERTGVEQIEREWAERTRADLERARGLLLGNEGISPTSAPNATPAPTSGSTL
jgi:outer membrane protein assembly factor BamD (BamD/ComL family)